ncbi:MAG: DeoR family transcriptional regulator [Planctomycetes bacterium]|nr:DeoR family transcriptional regulator [Planctomycetota bacterium]
MGLLAENRQQHILGKLRQSGQIKVRQLAAELNVTEVTIRRDLRQMQSSGLLKKTYGGAVPSELPDMRISVHYRQTRNLAAKKIIGKLAAELIEDNDIIFLEAGSTCFEIIPHLARKKNLTVIVNSLHLMQRLALLGQHKIIITGGQYRRQRMEMTGPGAENAISQLSGFKAFTGADDISISAGISGADVVTVSFAKLVLRKASEVIFVGDSTKFDNPALYKIADLGELDYIVTNVKPPTKWIEAARGSRIKIIYPKDLESAL